MILRVGLTGGIASGKSTVARFLAQLGCTVIDADDVVRDLYRPGRAGHDALVRRYGSEILTPTGEIDRPKLSSLALGSAAGAAELNALIHPLVIAEEEWRMSQLEESDRDRDTIVVIEATLLLESGGRERYHRIIVADIDEATQIERAVTRGMDADEVARRIARQMPRDERRARADYIISTAGTIGETFARTEELVARLRTDLEARKLEA